MDCFLPNNLLRLAIAKPRLYAELYLPMYFVLSFSFVISDMYAEPTERLHEKHPAITLEIRTKGRVLAKAMIKCEAKSTT